MDIDWLRNVCLSLPGATEQIQWEIDLVFKVGGKMFAIAPLEPARVCLTFKCSDEEFADLTERPGVIPAPYLARARWVALESEAALPRKELEERLRQSYALIFARLPKKAQEKIRASGGKAKTAKRKRPRR